MSLGGCAVSGAGKLPSVALPDAPSYMAPVGVPELGRDARAALPRYVASTTEANRRLAESRRWYLMVRKHYGTR